MTCSDLLNIPELSTLKLISGEKGLGNLVRWIYFADCLDSLDDTGDPGDWFYGGELIVITSKYLTGDQEIFCNLLQKASQKGAAGFIINTGCCTPEVIELTNGLNVPVFELPWSIKSVDLSQIICKMLIEEENAENTLDNLLNSILYSGYSSEDDVIYKALYYGCALRQRSCIAIFDIDDFNKYIKEHHIVDEGAINNIKHILQKLIKNGFRQYGIKAVMTLVQSDSVVVLYPTQNVNKEIFLETVAVVSQSFQNTCPNLTFTVGVGNSYQNLEDYKRSFQEASKTLEIAPFVDRNQKVFFYDSVGVYSLLFYIEDKKALHDFCKRTIGALQEYDKINSTWLCGTAEMYLLENCNATNAAKELFIHRNTMIYRLKKISDILNINFDNVNDRFNLLFALYVNKYLHAMHAQK